MAATANRCSAGRSCPATSPRPATALATTTPVPAFKNSRRFNRSRSSFDIATLRLSVVVDPASHFPAQPAGVHILHEQRARPVLLAERAVEIFQDAQPCVESDEVHQLERPHR